MKMSLLHAAAALLTALLLLMQRHAFAAVCSKGVKYRQLQRHGRDITVNEFCYKNLKTLSRRMNCAQNSSFEVPKYKKDPEIHVDDKGIGLLPYED